MNKIGVKNLRVYVNAYNLLTFSGLDNIDPERPGYQGEVIVVVAVVSFTIIIL